MADQTTTIPKGWKMTTLGEVADVQNGYAFRSDEFSKSGTPIIKIKNIASGKITLDDLDYYEKDIENLKAFQIKKGDILVSMTGSHISQISSAVGKVAKYNLEAVSLLNQRVGKIYPKENLSENKYLWYLVVQPEVQFFWGNKAGGSANQANISPSIIKSYQFISPSLPEQRAIAGVLSSLDDKIELLCEQNKTLEATAQAIFKEWFVNFNFPGTTGKMIDSELGEIPEGWRVGKFGDIFKIEYGRSDKKFDKDGNFPVYGAGGIVGYSNSTDYQGYQVIVGCRGTCGNVTLAYVDSKITHNSLIINNEWFKPYSYLFLQTIDIKRAITGSTQPQITIGDLGNIQIYIPEDRLIKLFSENINSVFEKISNNNSQIETLSKIRDTLLPKLMKGDVRIKGFKD